MQMKKRYIILILLLCVVLALGAFLGPVVYRTVRVYRLAEEFWTSSAESMDVTLMLEGEKNLSFRLDWQDVEDKRIFAMESGAEQVYYCDGVVYLKNGKGYRFAEALPDLTPVLQKPWILLPLVQIQKEENQWILSVKTETFFPEIRDLNVTMEEGEQGIRSLQINTLGQKMGDFVGLTAQIQEQRPGLQAPQEVLSAIKTGAVQGDKDLTRDMLRLVKGWMLLNNTDPLAMTVEVQVDLLELPLSTELTLYSTKTYGKPIHYLNKNGVGIYFTEGAACTPEGVRIGSPDGSVDAAQLLGFAYYLCFNGDLSCQGDVYRLALDQQGMEQVLYTLVPEAKDMSLTLKEGALELHMEGDAISALEIAIAGQVDLVITQVDVGLKVNARIGKEDFVLNIPQEVLKTLLE